MNHTSYIQSFIDLPRLALLDTYHVHNEHITLLLASSRTMGWAGYLVQTPAGAAGPSCARLLEFQRTHPASEQQATPGLVKVQLGTQPLAAAVAEQGLPPPYTAADAQAPQVPASGTGLCESGPAGAASALVQLSSAAPAAEDIPVAMNGAACAIVLPTEPPAKKPRLTARKHDSVGAQWEAV